MFFFFLGEDKFNPLDLEIVLYKINYPSDAKSQNNQYRYLAVTSRQMSKEKKICCSEVIKGNRNVFQPTTS